MYYALSKLLWFFATPSNVILALAVAGAVMLRGRHARWGRRLVGLAAALFVVFGLSPVPNWLLAPLEQRFPAWVDDGRPIAAIVVLGGAIETGVAAARGQLALNDAAERMIAMGDLARRFPAIPVVFTGGAGSPVDGDVTESEVVEPHLSEFGLPGDRVRFERRSRNTVENARFTRALLDLGPGDRVLLVTSAFHMARSVGLFRGEGYDVVAYPVDFRTRGADDAWRPFIAASDGLRRTDMAVREWIGLAAARLLGQSRELFPAP
ncbi:MAG: YdcF family protein [Alsobacter sp.]